MLREAIVCCGRFWRMGPPAGWSLFGGGSTGYYFGLGLAEMAGLCGSDLCLFSLQNYT